MAINSLPKGRDQLDIIGPLLSLAIGLQVTNDRRAGMIDRDAAPRPAVEPQC